MLNYLLGSTLGMLSQNVALGHQNDYLDKQLDMQQKYVKEQLNNATSLFNRNYYRNFLEAPSARNMLKRVQEQLNEQSRALRNTAVVTGATGQNIAAVQKANNKALDEVIGTLASADAQNKERHLLNYENTRNKLNEYLHGGMMNYYNQKMKLQGDAYSGLNSFLSPYLQKSLNSMSMPTL